MLNIQPCAPCPATAVTGLLDGDGKAFREFFSLCRVGTRGVQGTIQTYSAPTSLGERNTHARPSYHLLANTYGQHPNHHHKMVLSVSGFPEPSPGDTKLINRLFGPNRSMDDAAQPRHQTRPLPSSSSPSTSPHPVRATGYKRSRTTSQGFGSGSLRFFLFLFFSRCLIFFPLKRFNDANDHDHDEHSHTYFMGLKACRS